MRQKIILTMNTVLKIAALCCLPAAMAGCDQNSDGDQTMTASQGWLTRVATPSSEFSPGGIESTIDNVVAEFNKTDQQVGMKISFMPKALDTFFEDAVLGANRAYGELGVLGSVVAPERLPGESGENDPEEQLAMFQEQVADGMLNFGVAPNSAEIRDKVDMAIANGGVVVTFDSDAPTTQRQLFVGTNNAEAGKTAGNTMLAQIGAGKIGTVVILGYTDEGWEDGYSRTQEAAAVLEAAGHTVVILHSDWSDYASNVTAIQDAFAAASPATVGCLGVFNVSYACAEAVVASQLQSSVKVVAFDTEPATRQYMNDGIIQATHTQRLYYMGYLVPYVIYAIRSLGLERTQQLFAPLMTNSSHIDTGLDVIHAEKLSEYDAFLDTLHAL